MSALRFVRSGLIGAAATVASMAGFAYPCLGAAIIEGGIRRDSGLSDRTAGADRALPQATAEFAYASEMAASAG